MNAVTKPTAGGISALDTLKQNLAQVRNRVPDAGGVPYLRMLTDGDWVFGAENNAVKDGTEVVANVLSIKQGYVCWTDRPGNAKNDPKGEEMVPLGAAPISKSDLPVYYDEASGPNPLPWKEAFSIELKFLDGKYEGTQVLWKNNSVGGMKAFGGLLDAILGRVAENSSFCFPIIMLTSDHYQHKAHGRTWFPVVEVVGWMDQDGNEDPDFAADGEDDVKEIAPPKEEPKASRRRAVSETPEDRKPEPEPEPAEAEAPAEDGAVRRRRRR